MKDPKDQRPDPGEAVPDDPPLDETTPPMDLMEKADDQADVVTRDD